MKKMTRQQLIAWASNHSREVSFVANLIYANHGVNVHKRLLGLHKLVTSGFEVRTAPFSTELLVIGSKSTPFASLEDTDALVERLMLGDMLDQEASL